MTGLNCSVVTVGGVGKPALSPARLNSIKDIICKRKPAKRKLGETDEKNWSKCIRFMDGKILTIASVQSQRN